VPTLSSVFREEGARTRELFERAKRLALTGSWPEALATLGELEGRLEARRRRLEERVLPLFEIKAGSASELTRTLAQEHGRIEVALKAFGSCLRARGGDDLPACARELQRLLEEHEGRAGRLVFPLLDRLLSDTERRRLLVGGLA